MNRNVVMGELMTFLASIFTPYRNEKEFRDDMSLYFQKLGYFVHIEYPIPRPQEANGRRSFIFIDLVLEKAGQFFPIELKYKTNPLLVSRGLSVFNNPYIPVQLTKDSAHNDNCFSIWRDVQRIEMLASEFSTIPGCTIVLTNDPLYWNGPNSSSQYYDISVRDGRTMPEGHQNQKSAKSVSEPLILQNSYPVSWRSTLHKDFRFLVLG